MASLGERVKTGQVISTVSDPFGRREVEINAKFSGIVIGRIQIPLVNEGDAVYHIARFDSVGSAQQTVESFQDIVHQGIPDIPPVV